MFNLKKILVLVSILAPLTAGAADVAQEIAYVRTLLPLGQDIAQVQAQLLRGATEAEAFEAARANYVLRDVTGDGLIDLLVISEPLPQIVNYNTNQPCKSVSESQCTMVYGRRELHFFVGDAQGRLTLNFTNKDMVLAGDEGGVFGDPLNGLSVRKSGAIALSVYGGSAWRWGFTDVMQFRDGDLKLIGQDSYEGWTGDGRSEASSTNLITGEVVETSAKNGDAKEIVKRYHVARKPLVNIRDYKNSRN
jgi:hypothetical protein